MKKVSIAALILTVAVMIPVLFLVTRGSVGSSQFVGIVSAVLLFVVWTIPYVKLVDPWLRRMVGAVFNVTIEWRGTSKSLAWTADQERGCLTSLLIDLLGYLFIILWLVPLAAAIALVLWFQH